MLFYLLILMITVVGVYFFEKINKYDSLFFWLSAYLLIFVVGLRSTTCADDTFFYYSYFINPEGVLKFEVGYDLLNKLIYYLSGNFNCLLLINAALSIIPTYYVISKINKNKYIFVFLYQSLVLYLYNFAIMRQSISMAFCMLGIYFLLTLNSNKSKIIAYFICFIIALSFHRTALIFFPIIILYYFTITKKILLFVITILIVITLFRKQLLLFIFTTFFPDKLMYIEYFYFDIGIIPICLFSFVCFIYLFIRNINKDLKLDFLFKINFVFLLLSTCFSWFPATGRLLQYGYLNLMFVLGIIYQRYLCYNKKLNVCFISFFLIFYIYTLFRNPYSVIPYQFFI